MTTSEKSESIFTNNDITSILSISIAGAMRICLTDPQGRQTGVDPATNNILEQIPGSEIFFGVNGGEFGTENPLEGFIYGNGFW
ncbi:MAG: hypothetical protein J7K32_04520 [Deltaproteobacteria bacterium]|nr:hypothetical protein [Deltaproteobacteria bacterium]